MDNLEPQARVYIILYPFSKNLSCHATLQCESERAITPGWIQSIGCLSCRSFGQWKWQAKASQSIPVLPTYRVALGFEVGSGLMDGDIVLNSWTFMKAIEQHFFPSNRIFYASHSANMFVWLQSTKSMLSRNHRIHTTCMLLKDWVVLDQKNKSAQKLNWMVVWMVIMNFNPPKKTQKIWVHWSRPLRPLRHRQVLSCDLWMPPSAISGWKSSVEVVPRRFLWFNAVKPVKPVNSEGISQMT